MMATSHLCLEARKRVSVLSIAHACPVQCSDIVGLDHRQWRADCTQWPYARHAEARIAKLIRSQFDPRSIREIDARKTRIRSLVERWTANAWELRRRWSTNVKVTSLVLTNSHQARVVIHRPADEAAFVDCCWPLTSRTCHTLGRSLTSGYTHA